MNRLAVLVALALLAATVGAAEWPYNEKADAAADVRHALAAAQTDHKKVLLVFGANWCGDCRALDKAMHGSSQSLIEGKFDVVKIDVGNFDKNLVLGADNHVIYSTKGGELADARKMGEQGIYDFLSQKVAASPSK